MTAATVICILGGALSLWIALSYARLAGRFGGGRGFVTIGFAFAVLGALFFYFAK